MHLDSVKILREKGVPFRIIELSEKAISVEDVIEYSKSRINPEEICKTIIVKDKKGEKYGVFLRGSDRIDFNKLNKILGKVSIASLEDVKESTGVEPGSVCPLTLQNPILVDERVLSLEKINFGSGNHLYGIELKTSELKDIINYQVKDIASLG
jgi:prolyl-tRNA editing enzyme YbaK/EbsC (Cys-tRNA(Pro) deacylase)